MNEISQTYLPFGELFVNQQNSTYDTRYKFSAKELDDATNYTYFGARYYDSDLSSWLSVDPMADERNWVSPYSYCQNNPVMRVDPTGALDDEWDIDVDGNVNWMKESKTHVLYALGKDGNRTGQSETFQDRNILDQLTSQNCKTDNGYTLSYATNDESSQDEMVKAFKFMADNTKVEWRVDRYIQNGKTQYSLGTLHQENLSPSASSMGHTQESTIAFLHSHPLVSSSTNAEISSMGYWPEKKIIAGDSYNKAEISSFKNSLYYTYFPQSKNLWIVRGHKKPAYIRNIGGNYKNFFFGTINTK